jgi:hypothetical protein
LAGVEKHAGVWLPSQKACFLFAAVQKFVYKYFIANVSRGIASGEGAVISAFRTQVVFPNAVMQRIFCSPVKYILPKLAPGAGYCPKVVSSTIILLK